MCASSTYKRSTPSCSKVTTSSFRELSWSFLSLASRPRLVRSRDLMVNRSARWLFSSRSPSSTSKICSAKSRCCRSMDTGIFSNCEWPMITASYSPVAIRAQNFLRFFGSKSFFVATRMLAEGYSRRNSPDHCSVRWLGTTKRDLWHSPSRLDSMAAATISKVLPAPTSWARRVLPP